MAVAMIEPAEKSTTVGNTAVPAAADRAEIIELVSRVARAQDDLDPVAYRNCFTEMVWLEAAVMIPDWKPGEIAAYELTRITFATLAQAKSVSHLVTNHIVETNGDEGHCAADLLAVTIGERDGETVTAFMGGRYDMRLRRTADGWRIREREVVIRYRIEVPGAVATVMSRPVGV